MKPEEMQKIIDRKANGYEDIKPGGIGGLEKGIHIFTKLITIVVILSFVAICIYIILLLIPRIILFTGTNKNKFMAELEDRYNRKFEIVQDNTVSRRGTGTYVLRTTEEPIIEFNAEKEIEGNYKTDFEENLVKYYYENPEYKEFFEGVKLETGADESVMNKGFYFLTCKLYIDIDNYSQIAEATKKAIKIMQLYRTQITNFGSSPKIRKGDYASSAYYDPENTEEQQIYAERLLYYWYLKKNNKDLGEIPVEDLEDLKYPLTIDVYVDGKQAKSRDEIGGVRQPAEADFDIKTKEYNVVVLDVITNTEKVKLLNNNFTTNLKFEYKGTEYEMQHRDNEIHTRKLPYRLKINELQDIFGLEVEYDYDDERVDIWFKD